MSYIGQQEDEFNAAATKADRKAKRQKRGKSKHGNCEHCGTRFKSADKERHYDRCPRLAKLKRNGVI